MTLYFSNKTLLLSPSRMIFNDFNFVLPAFSFSVISITIPSYFLPISCLHYEHDWEACSKALSLQPLNIVSMFWIGQKASICGGLSFCSTFLLTLFLELYHYYLFSIALPLHYAVACSYICSYTFSSTSLCQRQRKVCSAVAIAF